MEQHSNQTELQEIREQLALLHRKIDREVTINENTLRELVRNNVSRLDRIATRTIILQLLGALYSWSFLRFGISFWFCCTTTLLFLIAAVCTYIFHQGIQAADIASNDLVEVCRKTYRLKRQYANWLKIGIPTLGGWFVWLILEIEYGSTIPAESKIYFTAGCIAGIIIGGIIGFYKHRKTIHIMNRILQDIGECRTEG